ncbi:hypothetical protein HJFPF1_07557 [Paramyrothecium foliicola]|nr:hypothetical protein HJFPF1_07557 [Paramyrothecium foliicola]
MKSTTSLVSLACLLHSVRANNSAVPSGVSLPVLVNRLNKLQRLGSKHVQLKAKSQSDQEACGQMRCCKDGETLQDNNCVRPIREPPAQPVTEKDPTNGQTGPKATGVCGAKLQEEGFAQLLQETLDDCCPNDTGSVGALTQLSARRTDKADAEWWKCPKDGACEWLPLEAGDAPKPLAATGTVQKVLPHPNQNMANYRYPVNTWMTIFGLGMSAEEVTYTSRKSTYIRYCGACSEHTPCIDDNLVDWTGVDLEGKPNGQDLDFSQYDQDVIFTLTDSFGLSEQHEVLVDGKVTGLIHARPTLGDDMYNAAHISRVNPIPNEYPPANDGFWGSYRIPKGTQKVTIRLKTTTSPDASSFLCKYRVDKSCHGILCTSFYPIEEPQIDVGLQKYTTNHLASHRFFCATCGCHVFRSRAKADGKSDWSVSTGAVDNIWSNNQASAAIYVGHDHVQDTKDGGASVWLRSIAIQQRKPSHESIKLGTIRSYPILAADSSTLPASCACGNVRFHITRPNASSYLPHSDYPDLMYPAKTTAKILACNPTKEKWWLQDNDSKYLAGTCACRSCRLFTGFEIQTWAFVPRTNIYFHTSEDCRDQTTIMQLDFKSLPRGILQSYGSSPGVVREFCGTCGATVFWHNDSRPDIIDVSVGLLRADEGARAEIWLHWWTDRVSFEEETETGREGPAAETARTLITALEDGLKSWATEAVRRGDL